MERARARESERARERERERARERERERERETETETDRERERETAVTRILLGYIPVGRKVMGMLIKRMTVTAVSLPTHTCV